MKTQKIGIFQNVFCFFLFRLFQGLVFLQGYRKVWIIVKEKLWRIEIIYYLLNCLWDLKVWLSPSKKFFVIYFNDSPSKMMINAFCLILKALFVLKKFKFFVMTFWSCRKSGLIWKIRLIWKFMTSQPG